MKRERTHKGSSDPLRLGYLSRINERHSQVSLAAKGRRADVLQSAEAGLVRRVVGHEVADVERVDGEDANGHGDRDVERRRTGHVVCQKDGARTVTTSVAMKEVVKEGRLIRGGGRNVQFPSAPGPMPAEP